MQMGPNLAEEREKNGKGNDDGIRWKRKTEADKSSSLKKNSKGGCRDDLLECPLVKKYQAALRQNLSGRISSAKTVAGHSFAGGRSDKSDAEKSQSDRDSRSTSSNALGSVRSTRAQDLRSRSNRDFLDAKTSFLSRSGYSSPYAPKKKKNVDAVSCRSARVSRSAPIEKNKSSNPGLKPEGKGKPRGFCLRTEESEPSTDSGGTEKAGPKKSATFFICKGPKKGRGDSTPGKTTETESPDRSETEIFSPRPKPITHNDSFCLIRKSSRNWSGRHRSGDRKLVEYGFRPGEKRDKKEDKGILKNSNRDLKSVDSLEKMESEKIVRFSEDGPEEKKVPKKSVRRKRRLENVVNAAWYRRNKLFQKYLQILKSKSILHAPEETRLGEPRPFPDSAFMKDRYEAEMLGLVPRHQRFRKGKKKIPTEDDDIE